MSAAGSTAVLEAAASERAREGSERPRESTPVPRPPRWLALDLFRFTAALLMVQGHVFTELLSTEHTTERWYRHHAFVHGYTAPMFLFAAGLAFGVTTFRAWDKATRPGRAVWARLGRYAMLIVIGYVMHWPALTPAGFETLADDAWQSFIAVDVLQHIGVSLGTIQLLALVLRKPERLVALLSTAFALVVVLAPYLWVLDPRPTVPDWLAGYMSGATGSTFPLLPWAAFTWCGVLLGWALKDLERPSWQALGPLALATVLVLVIPVAINRTGFRPYGEHDFWRASPYYFFFRLGNVMAVLAGACLVERAVARMRLTERSALARRAMRWAGLVGQESLVVYVAHLAVLHGVLGSPGLALLFGHTLSVAESIVAAVVVTVASMALAAAWGARKTRKLAPA